MKLSKKQFDMLFARLRFCPMCGGKLKLFGTSSSTLKTCDEGHGTMSILGNARGHRVLGALFEICEE